MTVALNHVWALKVLKEQHKAANRPGLRYLDFIYGPRASFVRQLIASQLHGTTLLTKSDKRCQYGNLRAALLAAVGAEGQCIAALDSDFQRRVEALEV